MQPSLPVQVLAPLMIIPAIFFTMAAYGHLLIKDNTMLNSILMSIGFAIFGYITKTPITKYGSCVLKISNVKMRFIWLCITFFLAQIINMYETNH